MEQHMNGMATRPHLIGMAVTAGIAGVGLLAWGVPAGAATGWAVVLACPLMMIGMMAFMVGRRGRHHTGGRSAEARHATEEQPISLPAEEGR